MVKGLSNVERERPVDLASPGAIRRTAMLSDGHLRPRIAIPSRINRRVNQIVDIGVDRGLSFRADVISNSGIFGRIVRSIGGFGCHSRRGIFVRRAAGFTRLVD